MWSEFFSEEWTRTQANPGLYLACFSHFVGKIPFLSHKRLKTTNIKWRWSNAEDFILASKTSRDQTNNIHANYKWILTPLWCILWTCFTFLTVVVHLFSRCPLGFSPLAVMTASTAWQQWIGRVGPLNHSLYHMYFHDCSFAEDACSQPFLFNKCT